MKKIIPIYGKNLKKRLMYLFRNKESKECMVHKLFKELFPKTEFIEFLKKHAFIQTTTEGCVFVITREIYKQLKYHGTLQEWYSLLLPYYYPSKQYYITRDTQYKSFATILRQLAKQYGYTFQSKIKYEKSQYTTDYHLHVPFADL